MNDERGDKYKGSIVKGQRVHSILYGGRDGIIGSVYGKESPESIRSIGGFMVMGGSAEYDVIFDNHISRRIPEAIIRGVQWFISNIIETPEMVLDATVRVKERERTAKQEAENAAEKRKEAISALPAKYPYLKTIKDGGRASSNIKTELKRAFSGVKFSVRHDGISIDVDWTDGPSSKQVEAITGKYQEGSFDGMTDCYNFDHSNIWPDVFGGARYVNENRHLTAARYVAAAAKYGIVLDPEEARVYGISNLRGEQDAFRHAIYQDMAEADYR